VEIPGRQQIPPCSLRSLVGMTRVGVGLLGWRQRTSGAEARILVGDGGAAEAVPFLVLFSSEVANRSQRQRAGAPAPQVIIATCCSLQKEKAVEIYLNGLY
jgi:hypothetical protein